MEVDIGKIYKLHFARLVREISPYVGREEARDIVSEVFVRCLENQHQFETDYRARAFIFIACKNSRISILRHRRIERKYHNNCVHSTPDTTAPDLKIARQEIRGKEHDKILREIFLRIGKFPKMQLYVLEQRLIGRTNVQIAQDTGKAIQTITNQIFKIRQKVRDMLKSFDHDILDIIYGL